jgi:hypothetical protein
VASIGALRERSIPMSIVYHNNPARQINTFYYPGENRAFSVPKLNKHNADFRHDQAVQYVLQFEEEGIDTYGYVKNDLWNRYKRWLWRKEIRHKYFPLPKVVVVVSEIGNHKLPERPHKRVQEVEGWIKNSIKRIHGSKGFGGMFHGSKPPRPPLNSKCIILDDDVDLEYIQEVLKTDGVKWTTQDENVFIEMDRDEALEYMKDRFVRF